MNSKFISSGILGIKNTGSQSQLRLYCEVNNAHYVAVQAPAHADFSGNLTFTTPNGYGSNGQVLQSNGSGGTSWVAQTTAYTNSSVDSHLNTSSASANEILSWNGSDYDWIAQSSGGGVSSDSNRNTAGGTDSGANFSSGTDNTLFGYNTGNDITSGSQNTFAGVHAGENVTSGYNNVGIGFNALPDCTNTGSNTAVGSYAAYTLNGDDNVALGGAALRNSTTCEKNVAVGNFAGANVSTGNSNVLIGLNAGNYSVNLTTGSNNICIGYRAATSSATVSNEVTIGDTNITKFRVPGIDFILKDNGGTPTQGHVLTVDANGEASFEAASGGGASTGEKYVLLYDNSGNASNTGDNTFAGHDSGGYFDQYSGGNDNTAYGYKAGRQLKTGDNNTCIGSEAGTNMNGAEDNVAIGKDAAKVISSGSKNIAIGVGAMASSYGAGTYQNTAIGYYALASNSNGYRNMAIGYYALLSETNGIGNTVIGYEGARDLTTGSDNTIIGYQAGKTGTNNLTTGSNNILLGHDAAASSATVSNEITLGDSNISSLRCNTQTISSLSDGRDKTNVIDLPQGLDFISKLRPVKFEWATRDGNGKDGSHEHGFIAQDLQEVQKNNDADYLNMVMDSNPDRLEASYGKLVPILVKAIQELTIEVNKLKSNV